MGFAQSLKGLRGAVFNTLGDPATLNGTVPIRARIKVREEALHFGQSSALASVRHIFVPTSAGVKRGDTITQDGRTYRVCGDPVEVRSGVHACPAVEDTP